MIQGMIDDRHDDMSYYDLQQALLILQANLPPPFDLPQLADLCRRGTITPVVFYDRCLDKVDREAAIYGDYPTVRPHRFKGLITAEILNDVIYKHISDNNYKTTLRNAYIYEQYKAYRTWDTKNEHPITLQAGEPVALFSHEDSYDSRAMTTYDQVDDDAITVGINDLLFPAEQVKGSIATYGKHTNKPQASQQTGDTPKGIYKVNADRTTFKATGIAIASYLWAMDTTQSIRTGDMAHQIKKILPDIDPNLVPDNIETIKGWLTDIAPEYAKKGGRTPNDTPNEITLTMKR